ncbi:XRE family transcriptional regulator [Sphingomonas koreensis]|uniref:XRE family transcriptional regulator n=1 Tax=Sphingomonas koreensis TaxID=93064 RepID=A0A430G2D3_9SPHN|nr:helix-turn-helix transcriptional regulator [Sphingomonas koreensis]RSY83131.1 XRE family transcriptional regulator [Sphingomonas koreensis]
MHDGLQPTGASQLFSRVERTGFSMADVCREARVAQSTPSRWKAEGWEPKARTLRKMHQALDVLIQRRDAAAPAEA